MRIKQEDRTRRHKKVIESLFRLSKGYKDYGAVNAHHISQDYTPVQILSSPPKRGAAEAYPYYPDLWCEWKRKNRGMIDIYEVWDSQSDDACVGDLILAALSPRVYMIYIVCFEERQYDLALKLVRVMLSRIHDKYGRLLLDPSQVKNYVALVPRGIMNDDLKLKKFLVEKFKF